MKKLLSTPYPNPSSYMTCLVTGSEAFELDSKAGSPETLSPLWRVAQFYHARLQRGRLLVSSLFPSLACGIGQGTLLDSLAFFPTLMLRIERGAAADSLNLIVQIQN